jgi:hypothetical protein
MQVENSLLNTRKFLPLFSVQFLNAMSDHMLKNAILVMITYQGLTIGGLSPELSVNISTLLFILPFFYSHRTPVRLLICIAKSN